MQPVIPSDPEINTIVRLEIKLHEYKLLTKTIKKHKSALYILKIGDTLKKDLIIDINKIMSILMKSEAGTVLANKERG